MKRRMNWYGICVVVMVVMMALASITFAQGNKVKVNGKNVTVSSGGNTVKLDKDKTTVRSQDGSSVKKKGRKVNIKSHSK